MNDDELELRLRDELHRRVVAPEPPSGLLDRVSRLGLDESPVRAYRVAARGGSTSRGLHRGIRVFGGLATAAGLVALLAIGLAWRSSHSTAGLGGASESAPASDAATASPSPAATPTRFSAWSGDPAYVQFSGRLDAEFGYAVAAREPYPSTDGSNQMKLYLTYDGGATWVDRTPEGAGEFLCLHFADRMNAWFAEDVWIGNAPVTGDQLSEHWIFRTNDGGVTWSKYSVPAPTIYMSLNFDMSDGQHGLMTFLSWDQSEPVYGSVPGHTSRMNPRSGMAATGPPRTVLNQMWGTSDGGATWTKLMDVRADADFPGWPKVVSADEAWAFRSTDSGAPELQHSTDGGRSWTSATLPMPEGYVTSSWSPTVPSGSGNDLSIAGPVMASADGVNEPSWAYATWVSKDGGATWALGSAAPLGAAWNVGPASWSGRYIGVDTSSDHTVTSYFDIDSPGSVAVLDASSVCRGANAGVTASVVSPQDSWVVCQEGDFPLMHQYLYGTTDGGQTWEPLMGAP